MKHKIEILLDVFNTNTGIWFNEEEGVDIWIRLDDGEVLEKTESTSDGLPQFININERLRQNKWFMDLIFNAELIEDY